MNPTKTYDYLTRARARLFDWVRPLTPEQYSRAFPVGRGTIGRTLTHILGSEWYYVERMLGRPVPAYERWPIREEEPPAFPALEAAWAEQTVRTRAALSTLGEQTIEYQITNDEGRREIITASPADIATQLILHEVHHRAQVMNNLRQFGIAAEDLDYNTLMYGRRAAPA
jgi:uncharacterized damage-inducible protein DinB